MPTPNAALKDRLSRYREINLSVTGRKSGQTISQPVWSAGLVRVRRRIARR